MIILLDNGHGAETKGKRSPDGLFREYSYCRRIAAEVCRRLKNSGMDARLLVPEENDIPLSERCRRANEICRKVGARNVCLISIHNNAAGNGSQWMNATGWEVWTTPGNTDSDKLANCLYQEAEKLLPKSPFAITSPQNRLLRPDFSDGDPDKEANFHILKNTLCAACLTENFFQDNQADIHTLLSPDGFETIVSIHVAALKNFIFKTR